MKIKQFFKDLYSVKSLSVDSAASLALSLGFGINRKHAGVVVNSQSALAHDTFFACVRDKSESIGQLPIELYKKGKKITSGREWRIFTQRPNDFQTWQEFVEMYVTAMELRGNFYALVERNTLGNVMSITPFYNQDSVDVNTDINGRVYYTYTTNDGKPMVVFSGGDLLHIKQFAVNGYKGLSTISYGARALGVAISQENHLSSVMENGAMPVGVLETENIFKDENAIKRLQNDWRTKYGGTANSGKTPLLENGVKYRALSLSPADSELILQRKFSREQICGMCRVPTERVGAEKKGNVNVEQSNTAYMRDSLVPVMTKLENNINPYLPDGTVIRFDEKGFTRGDRKTQIEVLDKEFKTGSISMNEVRVGMDREPMEGGEMHAIETNNYFFGSPLDIPAMQEQRRLDAQQSNQPESDPKEEEADAE